MAGQTKLVDLGTRSGLKVHPVSMGTMRFPESDDDSTQLIRQAIDAGMIYLDTSRGYTNSETKIAKALKNGYREKVILSTKWAPWITKIEATDDSSADCTYKRILESIERLDVSYLDFYQIWNIHSRDHWQKATCKGGMLDGIRRAMNEGLVRHTGFTTHDTPENISDYIDQADWCEVLLFTYNLLNRTYEDTIAKAHEKGIGTIVMNPVGGGMLAENSLVMRKAITEAAGENIDTVEAAHRYILSNSAVDTIVCGINSGSDVVSTVANYEKPAFTATQVASLNAAMKKISAGGMGFCSGCGYCMPCPQGINIPAVMSCVYLAKLLQCPQAAQKGYDWMISQSNPDRTAGAGSCVQCGQCEVRCTQKLNIPQEMAYASHRFENK